MIRKISAATLTLLLISGTALADDVVQHELPLNIPASGVIRTIVDRTSTKTMRGQPNTMVVRYELLETYACAEEVCTIRPGIVNATFISMNGQTPPKGMDTSALTRPFRLMEGVTYRSDTSFMPLTIEDLPKLKSNYTDLMLSSAPGNASQSVTPEVRARAEMAVDRTLTALGGADAAHAFVPERALLSWPHDTSLVLGVPISDKTQFASPIDGTLLPVTLTMTLVSWDAAKQTAIIDFTQQPDEDSLSAYLVVVTPKLMASVGAPAESGDLKGRVSVKAHTHCRYEMNTATGLVKKAECKVEKGFTVNGEGNLTTEVFLMSETLVP